MVLSYRKEDYSIPFTSECIIQSSKEVNDGDMITIIASLFSSVDFSSGAVKTSETLEVPIRICDGKPKRVSIGQSATLNCSDDDIANMYVTL